LARRLLKAGRFEGRAELLAQTDGLRVVGGPITMLRLAVEPNVPRSPFQGGRVPGTAWVTNKRGDVIGAPVLWVNDGALSTLEYEWTTDAQPTVLPEVKQLSFDRS
ncbi:MAG TPA: hypothetical protein VKI20_03875, partial [Acidimicrobiales bacterium]|nr:hypothetical protein [Acidimicrobiales bacterium]